MSLQYVTTDGDLHIFRTNRSAPNYRLIGIDVNDTEESNWKTIIAEHEKDVLDWATPVNRTQLVICYIHDVKNILQLHKINGQKIFEFPLEMGTIVGFAGHLKHSEIFYQFTSFLTPGIIYHCDLTELPPTPKVTIIFHP